MKTMITLLMFVLGFTNAFAVNIKFKFDINSSGPSIYACNAGLKHAPHAQRVCYERGNPEVACNPGSCVSAEACNCVCTGGLGSDAGEYRFDQMTATHAVWTDNGEPSTGVQRKTKSAGESAFNQVFVDGDALANQLQTLSFDLGSERYGAEFFVDICYRGSQIEYYLAAQQLGGTYGSVGDSPGFLMRAYATVTDLTPGAMSYQDVAGLEVKAEAVCDTQGKGTYKYAGVGTPGSLTYDSLVNDIGSIVSGDWTSATNYVSYVALNATELKLIDGAWVGDRSKGEAPRFCKIRYTFREGKRNSSDLLSQLRKWKRQSAQVCTYSEINEEE